MTGGAGPRALDPAAWSGRRVLLLAPHPDDEAFGAGGTAHLAARAGAQVQPVILARGDGGVDGRSQVAEREDESRRCCELLAVRPPVFLRIPSPELRADPAAAGRALAGDGGARGCDVLLVPSPYERHDTHRAVLLAALLSGAATPQAEWWGWGVWEALPLTPDAVEVDVTAARSAKTLAMSAHRSQQRERNLSAGQAARDLSQATFSRITGPEPRKAVERLLDLSPLGRRQPAPRDAAEAAGRVAAWLHDHAARWHAALWP
jgi:LmbE family N-acetylglucosaminyl deacetylase